MVRAKHDVPEDAISIALRDVLVSPNETDSNFEAANVVDALFAISRAINGLAEAVRAVKHVSLGISDDELPPITVKWDGKGL